MVEVNAQWAVIGQHWLDIEDHADDVEEFLASASNQVDVSGILVQAEGAGLTALQQLLIQINQQYDVAIAAAAAALKSLDDAEDLRDEDLVVAISALTSSAGQVNTQFSVVQDASSSFGEITGGTAETQQDAAADINDAVASAGTQNDNSNSFVTQIGESTLVADAIARANSAVDDFADLVTDVRDAQ